MITTRKRLLSLLLAFSMVITLLPHVSLAAEKEQKPGTNVSTETKDSKDTKEKDSSKIEEPITPVDVSELLGDRDGEGDLSPQEIHDRIHQYADNHYIYGAAEYTPKLEISIVESSYTGPVKAGSTVDYMIKYHYLRPDSWQLGWPGLEFMADWYGKANDGTLLPNKLVVKLPAGLSLKEIGGRTDNPYTEEDGFKIYELDLDPIAANDKSFFTTIKIYVENNGKEGSVNEDPGYVFPADAFTFTSSFEIVDRQNQAPSYVVDTYTQTVSIAPEPIKTYSPDVWAAKKSNLNAELQTVSGTQMAVFTWDIAVGLLNEGETLLPGNIAPGVENDENYYSRKGREYVESIKLTDSFVTMLSKDGNYVTDMVDKFVIQKYTGNSTVGAEYDLLENPAPVIWGSGAVQSLVMDQVESIDSDGDEQADTSTPIFTKYRVTIAFEVEEDWIGQFPLQDGYDLVTTNTVTMDATFAHLDDQVSYSTAEEPVELPTTPPAKLEFTKLIHLYTGGEPVDYDKNSHSPRLKTGYGNIQYVISASEEFSLYKKVGEDTYEVMEGFSGSNSYTVTTHTEYYLEPGITYTLSEVLNDDQAARMTPVDGISSYTNTPASGDTWTETFENKETVGRVWIHKTDDSGRNLGGARFGLFLPGSDTPVVADDTDAGTGYLYFENVPYGTYILREIHAPSGYAPDFEEMTITIDAEHAIPTEPIEASNTLTGVSITLIKYVGGAEGTSPTDIATTATTSFPGTFVLQRRTADSAWEDVAGVSTTVDAYGKIYAEVDAFASDGKVYYYRFVETMPDGYYDPVTGATGTVYGPSEDGITLTDDSGAAQPKEVKMYNRKIFSIKADKNFYTIKDDGTTQIEAKTTSVTLYKSVNGGTPSPVGTDTFGWTSTNPETHKYAEWSNLRGFENGQKVTYLLKESELEGYVSAAGNLLTVWDVDDSYYKINTDALPGDATFKPLLLNYRDIIPMWMYKYDYGATNSFVKGAKFTVYESDGTTIAKDAKTGAELKDIEITSNPYKFFLEAGKVYYFVENPTTGTSDGKPWHWKAYCNGKTSTIQNTDLHTNSRGTIDLSGEHQPARTNNSTSTAKYYRAAMYNQYEPIVKLKKVSSLAPNGSHISGAKFKVYTKTADGKFAPYPSAADQYEISATNGNVDGKYFPAAADGTTYYFRETTVPANYLDPDENFDLYHALDPKYEQGQIVGEGTDLHTFYPVTITNVSTRTTNVFSFTFKDIPNLGSLKVKKTVDGVPSAGFDITVSPGNIPPVTTDANGYAVFNNLPVYDENGQLIQYTIGEAMNPAQQKQYIQVSPDQTATLTLNTVTTVDINGDELLIENETRVSVTTTKVFRRAWEYGFVGWDYLMQGATIGLFKYDADTDKWVLVPESELSAPGNENPQDTDGAGQVCFTGLQRGVDYILVELASGNDSMYPYQDGGFKEFPPEYVLNSGIPDDDLHLYNVLHLNGSETVFDPQDPQYEFETERMVNSNHWVQFHIKKWLDATYDIDPETHEIITHYADATERPNPDEDTLLDNAVFELYRIVMPDNVDEVTFDVTGWEDPYNVDPYVWTRIGTYTSGTMYFNDERQTGEFMTDSDQDINDHYVYLLVEKNPGPTGALINPAWKYTFWHAEGTDYSVNIPGYTARDLEYTMDSINNDEILNATPHGPGPGSIIYLASVRIAKWQDSYDLESGNLNRDYQPLPGAEFELTLPNGTVISELTVGLETAMQGSHGAAIAQSGTFLLRINDDGTYDLVDYEASDEDAEGDVVSYPVDAEPFSFTQTIDGQEVVFNGYRILTYLQEVYAPEGYSYISDPYPMYLCFVNVLKTEDGASWVFNDAYFVLTSGKNTTETLAENQIGTSFLVHPTASGDWQISYGDGQSPLRIVDYPTENTMVFVQKYGYVPNENTRNLTSDGLDGEDPSSIGRIALGGVDFYIQKYDPEETGANKWKYWDYTEDNYGTAESAKFSTPNDGREYKFPKGLPEGTYRIWEDSLNVHESDYEMAYPESRPRVFTVTKATAHIHLYNPKKVSLEIVKEDMDGNALEGVAFVLTPTEGDPLNAVENAGVYTFYNIPTGTYVLSETKAGYSSAYLEMYLNTLSSGLGSLATTGALIGYEWNYPTGGEETDDRDVSISEIYPLTDATLELTIKNPKLVNVNLTKIKEGNPDTKIKGVGFNVYYKPFPVLSGDVTMSIPEAAFTTSVRGAQTQMENDGWTVVGGTTGSQNNAKRWNTGNNGVLSFTNQEPGVYVFLETDATTEYSIIKDIDNRHIFYVAVVTGGLDVNVNFTPTSATIKDYSTGGNKTITTYFEAADDVTANFTVENRPKVKIQATKIVDAHELTLSNSDDWAVILNLWSDPSHVDDPEQKPYALVKLTKTRKANDATNYPGPGPLDFKTSLSANAGARWFAVGDTYYLQEVIVTPEGHMMIQKVKLNGQELTANEDGLYEITIAGDQTMSLEITNDWLYGRVIFTKYDADQPTTLLTGAAFEVRYLKDGEWVKVPDSTVVESPTLPGTYVADFPLVSPEATEYRIFETDPPEGFLPNPNLYVSSTLSKDHNLDETGLSMPNSKGNWITITKYGNVHDATGKQWTVEDGKVEFDLYMLVDGVWTWQESKAVANGGIVQFLTIPGEIYAVKEGYFDINYYNGLESIWLGDTELFPITVTDDSGNKVAIYVLGESTGAVSLNAYNIPYIRLRIEKADIGKYQGEEENNRVQAFMSYSIYEVTEEDDLPLEPTRAQVEEFIATHESLIDGTTEDYDPDILANGTYSYWESSDPAKRWNPDKTYLLVETDIGANGDGDYDTLRKDDPRVKWYDVIVPEPDPNPDNNLFYRLENIYGNAKVTLEKTVVNGADGDTDNDVRDGAVESLMKGPRKLIYTITPTVTGKNQMLDNFILEEKGLTFTPSSIAMNYSFTKLVIGHASHHIDPDLLGISDATISAKVFFYDDPADDAQPISTKEIADISEDVTITDIPTAARYFKVLYYSQDVIDRTAEGTGFDNRYSLGEEFRVWPTTVYVTVAKQANGTYGAGVDPVTEIRNDVSATLGYPKWASDGSGTSPAGNTAVADEEIVVNPIERPKLQVIKKVQPTVVNFGTEGVAHVVYRIEITNKEGGVDFVNPVVTDILPTAVYYENVTIGTGSAGEVFTMETDPVVTEGEPSVVTIDGQEVSEAETAVTFYLTGTLKSGSTVVLLITAKVLLAATYFAGSEFQNDVYLSSNDPNHYYTTDNPYGCTFTDYGGNNGKTLAEEAARRGGTAPSREAALDEDLGDLATMHYPAISASAFVTVGNMTSVTLSKAVQGDKDAGFHETGVGTASRSNDHTGKIGSVEWRLAVTNGYTQKDYINKLVLGDVIPKEDDLLESAWTNNMVAVTSALNNMVPVDDYVVYYYTGAQPSAFAAMTEAIHDVTLLIPANGWYPASSFAPAPEPADPDPYFDDDNEAWNALKSVTAFVVVFGDDVHLEKNTTLLLTYTTYVVNIRDDDVFNDEYAFTNANNEFYITFDYYGMNDAASNPVSVTLMDKLVDVEGDVWIDEDQLGVQTHYRDRQNYLDYLIIQELADSISFIAQDNRTGDGVHPTFMNDTGDQVALEDIRNESIKHFRFEELSPAKVQLAASLYHEDANGHMVLNPLALKGLDAYNYYLRATVEDSSDDNILSEIFKLSPLGEEHYMSDEVTGEDFYTDNGHAKDNNFYDPSTRAMVKTYETSPFFLPYSLLTDQSKDIGFMMFRELEIKKVAADDTETVVEGAEFQVFGPFNENKGTSASGSALLFNLGDDGVYRLVKETEDGYILLKEETPVETTTDKLYTDENGLIKIAGLNWWKEYVIQETNHAEGYDLGSLVATANNESTMIAPVEGSDDSFTLKIPGTTKMTPADQVVVKNLRSVKVQLSVEKVLETLSTKTYSFFFNYKLVSVTPTTTAELNEDLMALDPINDEPLEIVVTGEADGSAFAVGSFDEITLYGEGTYVFEITELTDENFPGEFDELLVKTATVTVVWDEDEQKLVVDDIVYSEPDTIEGLDYEKFTNKYEAEGEWTPEAKKKLVGRPIVEGEFTFTVKEDGTTVATGVVDGEGNVVFTTIEYPDLSYVGTHTYVISEDEGSAPGVTYTDETITVTVVVDDVWDETEQKYILKATSVTYEPSDKTFINTFDAKGEFTPIAFKVLNGRDFNENEVFTLTLTDEEGTVVATGTVSGGSNGTPAQFTFNPEKLTYTQLDLGPNYSPKTYTYTLTETKGEAGGVTYSEVEYTVHVTISLHQNEDGTYSDILDVEDDMPEDGYYFTNTYETIPAALTPEAKKSMEGEPIPEPMTFDFVMTLKSQKDEEGNNITDAAYLTNDPDTFIKVGDNWTKSVTIPKNGTTGSVSFDEITYAKTGTYVFEIVETPGTNTHIDYDPAVWTYTVVVTDDKDGNLVAVDDYRLNGGSAQSGPAEFVNTYTPTPTTEKVKVQKILTGHPLYDAEHTVFTFHLSFLQANVSNGYILPENTTVEILGSDAEAGNADSIKWFDPITFTKAGIYQFLIEEEQGDNPKITYDPQKWVVTITVTDMLGNLAVTAGPSYKNQATSDQADWAIFTNNYNPDDTYLQPQVDKELIQAFGPTVEDKEFTFKLTPDPNNPVDDEGNPGAIIPAGGDVTTLTIPAGSTAHHIALFGQIRFTVAGTYIFTITEDEGTDAHIGYDPAEWTLTVVIVDNDGELEVDTDNTGYDKGSGSNSESAMIENNYVPEPTYLQPGLDKTVTNEYGPTVEDKIFNFKLTLKSQKNAAGEDMEGGVNIPDGGDKATLFIPAGATNATTHFGILEFVKAGTFVFEVTEDKEDEEGITYDETVWTLTVVIVDNDGVLAVESADYSDGDHADPEMAHFTNPYKPEPTHYQPKVTKVITIDYGPTVREKIFNFELTLLTQVNAAGETITGGVIIPDGGDKATVTIPAGGTTDIALFGNLEFVKAGTYTFKIVETAENEEGITYDAAEWTLTVVIRDTDGVLVVESYAYEKDGEIVDHSEATFDEDGKLVEEVADTVIGAEFTNPYKPEPTYYQPKVTKVIEIDYGPIVREKIFNFELTLLTQVDAAGDPITDGAIIP
ncbi:MAG: hypothetical protein J5493_08580, partial [Lachnospiraceae bacterium]|nr:hypothetical protein [Lachnospiraceae bacterium]